MKRQIKIEIKAKDEFWGRAFQVEWEHEFPSRRLLEDGAGHLLADREWLSDLEQVAARTFCLVVRAPDSPQRREWLSSLLPPGGRR